MSRVLGTPTADRLYEVQNFLGELYKVEPRPTGHVVTWDDYALLSDVSALWGEGAGTYRWRGETYPSGVTNPATGDVIKEPAGHFRHRNSSNAWVHLADPDDFIGDYNDETAADNHVTAVGANVSLQPQPSSSGHVHCGCRNLRLGQGVGRSGSHG